MDLGAKLLENEDLLEGDKWAAMRQGSCLQRYWEFFQKQAIFRRELLRQPHFGDKK